jgi:hypothetical protein
VSERRSKRGNGNTIIVGRGRESERRSEQETGNKSNFVEGGTENERRSGQEEVNTSNLKRERRR